MKQKNVIIALFLLLSSGMFAQQAVVNVNKVLASVPALSKIDTLVAAEQSKYIKDLQVIKAAYDEQLKKTNALYKEATAKLAPNAEFKPDAALQKEITLLQGLEKSFNESQTSADKKIQDYKNVLYQPYIDKINAAIKAIATKKKFKQVVNLNNSGIVWFDPATDITEDVIKAIK